MRLALVTDIHGNREAFAAVLADAADQGADRIALLGDLVGYGPDPEWCVATAIALVEQGALVVRGNHDHAVSDLSETMSHNAAQAMEWTRPRLSPAQKTFLAHLPLTVKAGDILLVHASANDPGAWNYVLSNLHARPSFAATDARLIFCGHVHVPLLIRRDLGGAVREQAIRVDEPMRLRSTRRWLAVVGSAGQPRDGDPAAGYAVYDSESNDLTFRRVPYDCDVTATKLRASGLPEELALRLVFGF